MADDVRDSIQETIRQRVTGLLKARPEVTPAEFGAAIGRGYAWVNAFTNGTRHANEIHLLQRIARFFGVSVGYLLNETGRDHDPGAATLLATYDAINAAGRTLLLDLAASLRKTNTGATEGSGGDASGNDGHTGPGGGDPHRRKRR